MALRRDICGLWLILLHVALESCCCMFWGHVLNGRLYCYGDRVLYHVLNWWTVPEIFLSKGILWFAKRTTVSSDNCYDKIEQEWNNNRLSVIQKFLSAQENKKTILQSPVDPVTQQKNVLTYNIEIVEKIYFWMHDRNFQYDNFNPDICTDIQLRVCHLNFLLFGMYFALQHCYEWF